MTKRAKTLYIHQFTGEIKHLSKVESRKLSEDWTKVEFVNNEEGKPVMRIRLANATVDVSENVRDAPEGEIVDGNRISE